MKKKVYIAGPITGDPDYKEKFKAVAEKVEALGLDPVNPAEAPEGLTYKEYMDRGLKLLMECDIICILPGTLPSRYGRHEYAGSKGAQLELQYARTVGLRFMEAHKDHDGEWQIKIPRCWDGMFTGK